MTNSRAAFQGFLFPIVPTYAGVLPTRREGTENVANTSLMPFIHLSYVESGFAETVIQPAILYTNQTSFAEAESIVDKIKKAIGNGGVRLDFKGGYLTAYKGNPFSQHYQQPEENIRAIYFNFELTNYET